MLVMGVGLVLVAFQGVSRGWLPNGPNGYKRGEGVYRDKNPIGFWLMFLVYAIGGVAVALYAIRALAGHAPVS